MAEYKQSPFFNSIVATTTDGDVTALYVGHTNQAIASSVLPLPRIKKATLSIKDVSGASDGANSEVTMQWHRTYADDETEVVRLAETPGELQVLFNQAGIELPPVTKSFGVMFRELKNNFFD